MRTFFKNIIVTVVLVLSLFSFETKGQIGSVYPVDLNVMLTPPYGTCLTDLSNSNRFVIQALLRDMNHGNNYEMLIQMRVKSLSSMNTVFLSYSNKFSIGMGKPAVVLGAGNTPVSISNFFESGNVLIGQNILNDNCLPEGAYLFCFQAFDAKAYYAKQRIPISKEFTVTAFLENGATPILISPANNDSLSCQLPNVIFQWQQPYITSGINSYTLQVAEANSPFDGPQIIENGGNLLIEKRGLMMPICDIPVTEANFKENHTYYWRVVMCDKEGKARASYPNKGASPVYKFVYCGTPQEPEPEDAWVPQIPMAKSIKKSLDRLRIDTVLSDESSCSAYWFQDPVDVREKYDGVVIEVKKKNQDTWTPFLMESKVATDTLVALSSLAYKETYMARGQYFLYEDGEKVYAPYSDTIEFKIPHPADTLECGNAAPELTDCTNAGERAELEIGDEFNANGTTVSIDTITSQTISGSSVIISGEGHLPFPILSNFGLKVSFDNIEINCADELKKGQVISVYDEKTAAMIDLNNILGKGAAGNDLKQEDASLTEVGPDDDLSGFKSGDLIVEDGKVSLIVGNGNVVQVGTVIDLSNSDAYNDNGALNDEDIYVKFSNPDHENIAFDDDPTGMIRKAATLSGKYVSFGKEYIIPWVATNPGRIFQLTAMPSKDLSKSGFTDVKFVLPASGTHVVLDAVENGDGSYSVSIPGMKVDVQNHVYAIARKGEGSPYENVGKLNLCCYSYKSKKVVIVPLLEGLSVNTDEVKKDLDRVYAKLGYTFEVELDDDAAHREGLSTTIGLETDFLSDFSEEMKELIFNYEINIGDAYDKDAAYLFLLDKPTGKYKGAAGIMPQGQQYGFIFMREVTSATPSITHTMAHELGHGLFGLDHIFSGAYGIKKGATYNLMDYTEKTPNDALSYHEWTQINLPLPSWSALSRAEDDMWLKSPILTRKLMRDICLSYKNKEIVNQSNRYIVPEKECRITKYKQNGYEFIYFYKSKEEAEKYLNDNNELNDKTYALNVIEDQKGTTQKIDAMLSSNLKTCPNVFDEDDDEDFILELLRKIKLANKFGEYLTLPFGSAEKDASEITLPNGSIITDVEVVVNKNSVSLKDVKAEHEWEIGFSDSVFCFGVSDETEQYPLQISCNATDATALRKYLGLKVSTVNSMPVQPTDHYIVSVDDATIRKSEDRTKFENKNIPMGTEVVIVSEETVKGKVVAYVKLVDTVPELFYYTTKSNLTKIEILEKPEDIDMSISCCVELPYAGNPTETQISAGIDDLKKIAVCGEYFRVTSSKLTEFGSAEDSKGYWTFDWEKKPHLTAKEIAMIRPQIAAITDKSKRESAYLKLQTKVEYHSQIDNQIAPYVTCNVTSVAMAFEMLGVSKHDFINKIEEGPITYYFYDEKIRKSKTVTITLTEEEKQYDFESFLDVVRDKCGMGARYNYSTWDKLADIVGITYENVYPNSSKAKYVSKLDGYLREGKGIVVSLFNFKGHIVRLQEINDTKMVIDDPYGKLTYPAIRDIMNTKYGSKRPDGSGGGGNGYDANTSNLMKGEDNDLMWSDIDVTIESSNFKSGKRSIESCYETVSAKISSTDKKATSYKNWWLGDNIKGKGEYNVRKETKNKMKDGKPVTDEKGKVVKETFHYYKSCGAMIKIYKVFNK